MFFQKKMEVGKIYNAAAFEDYVHSLRDFALSHDRIAVFEFFSLDVSCEIRDRELVDIL